MGVLVFLAALVYGGLAAFPKLVDNNQPLDWKLGWVVKWFKSKGESD